MVDEQRTILELAVKVLLMIVNHYKVVVSVTVLCAVIAAGGSLLIPNEYQATSMILLSPAPFKQKEAIGEFMPEVLSVEDYRILVTNDYIMARVRDYLTGKDWPEEVPRVDPEPWKKRKAEIQILRRNLWVGTQVISKTVNEVKYSPTLELQARADRPGRAADFANIWAWVAVQEGVKYVEKGREESLEYVKDRHKELKSDLDTAEQRLREFLEKWNVEELSTEISNKKKLEHELLTELAITEMDIARLERELVQLETELKNEPPTKVLIKAPPDDAVWLLKKDPNTSAKIDSNDVLKTEEFNPVYVVLRDDQATKKSELEGLNNKRASLKIQLDELADKIASLQDTYGRQKVTEDMLKREVEVLSLAYKDIADKLEDAKNSAGAIKTADIKQVSLAVPPDRKIRPARTVIVASVTLVGFIVSLVLAAAIDLSLTWSPGRKSAN